jgi:hypothetical protein
VLHMPALARWQFELFYRVRLTPEELGGAGGGVKRRERKVWGKLSTSSIVWNLQVWKGWRRLWRHSCSGLLVTLLLGGVLMFFFGRINGLTIGQ